MKEADIQRFFLKVDVQGDDDCWEWQGSDRNGYGAFSYRSYIVQAHIFSYEFFYGEVPVDRYVCHSCDNRKCVNPRHLWLGTAQENMDDKVAKGRQSRGTLGHNTLSEGDVLLIRELAPSVKQTDLAARFNISQANVSKIIRRQLWLHI